MKREILDPACGSRMFWFNKTDSRVIFGDLRTENHIFNDGRVLNVNPDQEMDFRKLPFPEATFNLVVFDPPHLIRAGDKSWLAKKYGKLNKDWQSDIKQGFNECFRVLKLNGTLIFKWSETQIKVSDVLALTSEKPLFGHKTRRTTHWIAFMKTSASSTSARVIPAPTD